MWCKGCGVKVAVLRRGVKARCEGAVRCSQQEGMADARESFLFLQLLLQHSSMASSIAEFLSEFQAEFVRQIPFLRVTSP